MASWPLKVMLIEDDEVNSAYLQRNLQRRGSDQVDVGHAQSLDVALKDLDRDAYDAAVIDLDLPDSQGVATAQRVMLLHADLPVIVISDESDGETASRCIDAGAQDCMPRSDVDRGRLLRAVEHAIRRKQREVTLRNQAWLDDLTGLPSRGLLVDRWDGAVARARRNGTRIGMVVIDIDNISMIANSHGHRVRDRILQLTSRRLTSTLRASDTVARIGGADFAIVIEGLTRPADAALVETKIHNTLARPFEVNGNQHTIRINSGEAVTQIDASEDISDILDRASENLAESRKAAGEGVVVQLRATAH